MRLWLAYPRIPHGGGGFQGTHRYKDGGILTKRVNSYHSNPSSSISIRRICSALGFSSDAAMDTVKLAEKSSIDKVVDRGGALWKSPWSGDTASKTKLLNLCFTDDTLFWPDLKQIITEVTGGKSTFLPNGKKPRSDHVMAMELPKSFRPFWNTSFRPIAIEQGSKERSTLMVHDRLESQDPLKQFQHDSHRSKPQGEGGRLQPYLPVCQTHTRQLGTLHHRLRVQDSIRHSCLLTVFKPSSIP